MEEHTTGFEGDPTSLMMMKYSNSPEASSGASHATETELAVTAV